MRNRLILVASILAIGICPIMAQVDSSSVQSLTLADVISATLENNFQIQISKNNFEIANNNNALGNAGMLPQVSATGALSNSIQDTDQEFASGSTQTRSGAKRQSLNTGIDLTWTLFDGTKMFATLDRLESQAILSNQQLKLQIDNTLSSVLQFYYRVTLEQERLALYSSNVEFSEQRVRIVDEKYRIGKESKLSLLQAKVDLNTDRSLLVQQRELLTSQKLNLLQLMSVAPMPFDLVSSVQIDTTLMLSDLSDRALINNPALLIQRSNEQIQSLQVKELSRDRIPKLNLNLGYGYNNLESEAGFLLRNQTFDFSYGLSAQMNLFNGFNQSRQIQNAQIQLENSQLLRQEAEQLIITDLLNNYTTYSNNLDLRRLESENLEVALENSRIALDRFRLGVSDALELREAQINAVNAQVRLLQAQYNAKVAEIELKRIAGLLSEDLSN
jgi:outer membrane protein